MRVKILLILFLVLLVTSVLAEEGPLFVYDAICGKDGSSTLYFGRESGEKIYTKDINVKAKYIGDLVIKKSEFNVNGEWNYDYIKEDVSSINERTTLFSNEVLFKQKGEYLITTTYNFNNKSCTIDYETRCPGFEFSCKLIGVYVDYCKNINNERFEAKVRILGIGKATSENLSLDNNVQFMLQADEDYEDYKGKISDRGSLPKGVEISNPIYSQYYFNVSNFDNIKSFVAKIIGINYIAGGCVNYPNISLYSYKECEDIIIKEKEEKLKEEVKESNQSYTGKVVSEQKEKILEELEKSVNTKEKSKWHLVVLFILLGVSIAGILYIILKRNFNKEPSL